MDTLMIDIQKVQQIASYLQAMQDHKAKCKQILLENEQAINPIAAGFYGDYTVYKITYAVLAIEESEDEEDDLDFGLEGKKAKVEKYEAYSLHDHPDAEGYYTCFDPYTRFANIIHHVKFTRVASIEKHTVRLTDQDVRDTGAWVFPKIEVPNANATGKYGGGASATIHFPPTVDYRELRDCIAAVVNPLPEEPKYSDFGITNNEFRALNSLR